MDMAAFLMDHGADPSIRDLKQGVTDQRKSKEDTGR